jgi:hypothetical protein
MTITYKNIRNVRQINGSEYLCTVDVNNEAMEFYAKPNGGGICDAVIADIAAGKHAGSIAAYVAPTPTTAQLLASLAAHRYSVETGGITAGGIPILTDDRTKLMLNGALAAATQNPAFSTQWKTPAGFVTLGAAQIAAIAGAVAQHISKCFSAEAAVAADIASYSTMQQVVAAFDAAMAS